MRVRKTLFALAVLAVAAAALATRLPRLAERPMHCDEGNQAVKAALLRESGTYEYDPVDHHGLVTTVRTTAHRARRRLAQGRVA